MCYGYYREKDEAGKESATSQVTMTTQAEKAVARFLARVRQMVEREAQKSEEPTG